MSEGKEELMDGAKQLAGALVQEITIGNVKTWYKSRTIWGGIVAISSGLVSAAFGVHLDASIQQSIVDYAVNYGPSAGCMVGGLVAIYGRIKAIATIGKAGS